MKVIKATRSVTGCVLPFVARDTSDPVTYLTNLGFVTVPVWVYTELGKHWYRIDEIDKEDREALMKLPVMSKELQAKLKEK